MLYWRVRWGDSPSEAGPVGIAEEAPGPGTDPSPHLSFARSEIWQFRFRGRAPEMAAIHDRAHAVCCLARSVRFPVEHEAVVSG